MRRSILASVAAIVLFTATFGFLYPLAMTGLAAVAFPHQAGGSLVVRDGRVVGSRLAAQGFSGVRYFHERPSATSPAYNAAGTTFSNLGPTSPALTKLVAQNAQAVLRLERRYDPKLTIHDVPVDAVVPSASGIDPDISLAYAHLQARRVAAVRHLPLATVEALVRRHTDGRWLGLFGEPGVNVLELNLALDRLRSA
ncbi:MAG TPA: potassium-transporting ATPase subunit KdpC [Gaiellaceae bacterium]|nr:potassium-transporting ATPase subunit KdpC [Gaiellaceae bacterium]